LVKSNAPSNSKFKHYATKEDNNEEMKS